MLRLTSEITITQGSKTWKFNALNSCNIVEDMATLTDTCELILPKKVAWQKEPSPTSTQKEEAKKDEKPEPPTPLKRGDKVTVKLGYNDNLKTRFVGYIRKIDTKNPVKIECEDRMYELKTIEIKKKIGYKKVTLKKLMDDLLGGTKIEYALIDKDTSLGAYRMSKNTVAEELNALKSKYPIRAYFRIINEKSILYVGLGYPLDNRKRGSFIHAENLISEEFSYRNAEDIKIKVKAISKNTKKPNTEVIVGDKEDGELYTVYHTNLNKKELTKFAESELKRFKTTGFKGSFETFGEPCLNKCDIAVIETADKNKGDFLIKKIEVNFGMEGYRQKIELGQPLN